MPNHSFRYLAEEILTNSDQRALLEQIMTLPIDEVMALTEDELNEDIELRLADSPLHE